MYNSKQWSLPVALKQKTVTEINEISLHTLVGMMTDDLYLNFEVYDGKNKGIT